MVVEWPWCCHSYPHEFVDGLEVPRVPCSLRNDAHQEKWELSLPLCCSQWRQTASPRPDAGEIRENMVVTEAICPCVCHGHKHMEAGRGKPRTGQAGEAGRWHSLAVTAGCSSLWKCCQAQLEGEQSTRRHLDHWYIPVPEHPWEMNKLPLEPNKWHSRSSRCQGIRNLSQDLPGKVRKVLLVQGGTGLRSSDCVCCCCPAAFPAGNFQ